jgi:hypothetical protein
MIFNNKIDFCYHIIQFYISDLTMDALDALDALLAGPTPDGVELPDIDFALFFPPEHVALSTPSGLPALPPALRVTPCVVTPSDTPECLKRGFTNNQVTWSSVRVIA